MAKQTRKLSFTFENPNTTALFAKELRKILIDKLAARRRERI